jgi:hypothetical protein
MPFVRRTRATLRRAELGFFGVAVYTRVQTPRRCGAAVRALRPCPDLRPGVETFFFGLLRPFLINWLVFGTATHGTDAGEESIYSLLVLGRRKPKNNDRPVLAIDIDGVISLFGFDESNAPPGEFHLVDGIPHFLSRDAATRINGLLEVFEGVWASGWEDRANDHLPRILGLPELPFLSFDGRARFGTAHWKLEALEEYGGERPLAWIDDNLDRSCYKWAKDREAPTLLVPTESDRGIEEAHVDVLRQWVEAGYTPR